MQVAIHENPSVTQVAVCFTADAGSKYDPPGKTGLAHLLEHILFTGTAQNPIYDDIVQMAGGDGNAYTNQDIACYYAVLPKENLHTYLALEADRFQHLAFFEKEFVAQQRVVIEEYKETVLNEPYGDLWHHLSDMAYADTCYGWPAIGKEIEDIKQITLTDLSDFYQNRYHPKNMVLTMSGPIDTAQVLIFLETLFDTPTYDPLENPVNTTSIIHDHSKIIANQAPVDLLFLAFPMADRSHLEYFHADFLTELLSGSNASRLDKALIKNNSLATDIDVYVTGHQYNGLFVIEARPSEGISLNQLAEAILQALGGLELEAYADDELARAKNKIETHLEFTKFSSLSKAMHIGFYVWLQREDLIQGEIDIYRQITATELRHCASKLFNQKPIRIDYAS